MKIFFFFFTNTLNEKFKAFWGLLIRHTQNIYFFLKISSFSESWGTHFVHLIRNLFFITRMRFKVFEIQKSWNKLIFFDNVFLYRSCWTIITIALITPRLRKLIKKWFLKVFNKYYLKPNPFSFAYKGLFQL